MSTVSTCALDRSCQPRHVGQRFFVGTVRVLPGTIAAYNDPLGAGTRPLHCCVAVHYGLDPCNNFLYQSELVVQGMQVSIVKISRPAVSGDRAGPLKCRNAGASARLKYASHRQCLKWLLLLLCTLIMCCNTVGVISMAAAVARILQLPLWPWLGGARLPLHCRWLKTREKGRRWCRAISPK